MRPRFLAVLLVVVIVTLLFAWWLRPSRRSLDLQSTTHSNQTDNDTNGNTMPVFVTQPSHQTPVPPVALVPGVAISQSGSQNRLGLLQQALAANNSPVDFYGKAIDQDSNDLSGVKINFYIRHWELTQHSDSIPIRLQRESGPDGRFEIHGVSGDAISVESIGKDGYELEPMQNTFGPASGGFINPVIFKMWNTNIHEQLITGDKPFHIVPDGRPYFINLADDSISESGSGDLKLWLKFDAPKPNYLYDWSCKVEVMNGGLLEQDDLNDSMYLAPTAGYTPSFQLQQQIKGGQHGSTGSKRFYINLNNGQTYGRIQIELMAYYNNEIPGMIRLSYAINPSGSRILR